jgi:hypothetical protein
VPSDDGGAPTLVARAGPETTAVPDRDTIVEAWGDHIQRTLPAKARALYGAGWFVGAEGATATFALPNATHRDRCAEVRGPVEQALASHFGTPIRLELVVVAPGAPPSDVARQPGGPTVPGSNRNPGRPASDETDLGDEEFDPDEPGDAIAVESLAEERLFQAFPGAQEVPK